MLIMDKENELKWKIQEIRNERHPLSPQGQTVFGDYLYLIPMKRMPDFPGDFFEM